MFTPPNDWNYAEEIVKEKQSLLNSISGFQDLLEKLSAETKCISYEWTDKADNNIIIYAKRLHLKLQTSPECYELFFNSACGYRAAHFLSPAIGLAVNYEIIKSLKDKMIDKYLLENGLPQDKINTQLVSEHSKIWICEKEQPANTIVNSFDFFPELTVQKWIDKARASDGKQINGIKLETREEKNPLRGIRYYTGEVLDIKGPFIKENGDIIIPAIKANRAEQIHNFGFT